MTVWLVPSLYATILDLGFETSAGLDVIIRVADENNQTIGYRSPSVDVLENLPAEPNTEYYVTVYGLYGNNGS